MRLILTLTGGASVRRGQNANHVVRNPINRPRSWQRLGAPGPRADPVEDALHHQPGERRLRPDRSQLQRRLRQRRAAANNPRNIASCWPTATVFRLGEYVVSVGLDNGAAHSSARGNAFAGPLAAGDDRWVTFPSGPARCRPAGKSFRALFRSSLPTSDCAAVRPTCAGPIRSTLTAGAAVGRSIAMRISSAASRLTATGRRAQPRPCISAGSGHAAATRRRLPDEIDFDALIGDLKLPGHCILSSPAPVASTPAPRSPCPDLQPHLSPGVTQPARPGADVPKAMHVPHWRPFSTAPAARAAHRRRRSGGRLARRRQIFRAMAEGLREVLISRAAIKCEFRITQTMISARGNNALEVCGYCRRCGRHRCSRRGRPGYMEPLAAAQEACADIKSHELAVMAGVQAALLALLRRFDPNALEERLSKGRLEAVRAQCPQVTLLGCLPPDLRRHFA